jgi:hypothetical protein
VPMRSATTASTLPLDSTESNGVPLATPFFKAAVCRSCASKGRPKSGS